MSFFLCEQGSCAIPKIVKRNTGEIRSKFEHDQFQVSHVESWVLLSYNESVWNNSRCRSRWLTWLSQDSTNLACTPHSLGLLSEKSRLQQSQSEEMLWAMMPAEKGSSVAAVFEECLQAISGSSLIQNGQGGMCDCWWWWWCWLVAEVVVMVLREQLN